MGQSLPARPATGIFVVAFLWSWVHLLLLRLRQTRAEVPRHSTALWKTRRTLTTPRRGPVRMQAASDGRRPSFTLVATIKFPHENKNKAKKE